LFLQAEDGIRDFHVTGVQTCALPIFMAGTGGGADQIARLLQGLIEQKELSPRPFVPINKPGGSGAEALRYVQDKAGDDHTVLVRSEERRVGKEWSPMTTTDEDETKLE